MWWLAPSPHSERVPGSIPTWGLSVWSLHVLRVYARVLSWYSGFLPLSQNMHVRLIGVSKLSLGVSVCGCLSLCGPVMDWQPVQGLPRLSPDYCWDRLQPPPRPDRRIDVIENGCSMEKFFIFLIIKYRHTKYTF